MKRALEPDFVVGELQKSGADFSVTAAVGGWAFRKDRN
jgi:hypothetical protein